jgi:hypothetical protein
VLAVSSLNATPAVLFAAHPIKLMNVDVDVPQNADPDA